MKTRKLDTTGMTRQEIKEISDYNGYSKSTYYKSIKRVWIITKVD